tara:strand:+ start:248 stop:472 length:225 start_codon:yes stop_codon:yes gene_type:complete
MAKIREGDGGSPYTKPPKPHPGPFSPPPKKKLAKGKSLFSTPYHDDLRNINKFRDNADKVFKRNKKATNDVNKA